MVPDLTLMETARSIVMRRKLLGCVDCETYFCDANLDGQFNTADLVFVFQCGKYEDTVEDNASWGDGDWDGDKDFTSSDFVAAFQGSGYEQGPRTATASVPEPATLPSFLMFGTWLGTRLRSRRS